MILVSVLRRWLRDPQPILRLELIRFLYPLAAVGFIAPRLSHADELLGESGFRVPDLGVEDWRQPLYLPPLPNSITWLFALATILSGLALSLGYRTRLAAGCFAVFSGWIAFADRLAAFTVTKLCPILALALFFSPCGARYSIDSWITQRRASDSTRAELVASGGLRFIQVLLPVFYAGSGLCKARGQWLSEPYVLWTHVHDSYQTGFSWALARFMPPVGWTGLQLLVLIMELLAPLWLLWKKTRSTALLLFLGMHTMIGLMFGPVKWFAMLMIALLLGGYLPDRFLLRLEKSLSSARSAFHPRRDARH
jgi:hypothetical protein